ncbi:hypothetical protein O0L34_g4969 [Tuta absoluta]|nr:hypothetical protein O0L34_g4969 [Tuta absoluta]
MDATTLESGARDNAGFEPSPELTKFPDKPPLENSLTKSKDESDDKDGKKVKERPQWGNQLEFLMSCIATSVGFGNIWRFPFVAYENGGGAFLIPYILVLLLLGKPMYYLETFLGQFSSSNCVKIWALSPAMRGTGYNQALTASYVLSYYVAILALCLYYFSMSFQSTLPWAVCKPEWENCVPSGEPVNLSAIAEDSRPTSSAEYFFSRTVLRLKEEGIEDGIGTPLWDLTICLFVSWFVIYIVVSRGVKSSGKASYFLALFPYVILLILLIRATTLPGAGTGIMFFLTPKWDKLLELKVWYAAITQLFFSLSVCSGALIMFSSYNRFDGNVYRDSMIVTTLDTFTSLISGITIFGVLGNLAFELGVEVENVIGSGGTSLAFVSYPDAIAKSPVVPQLFSVLFFLMMAVLGVGTGVALLSTVNTVLIDTFPRIPIPLMSAFTCSAGFLIGLVYVTPGGQYILELVDHYGGTFLRLFAAITETIGVIWIYGLENICLDIEFMLGIKTSFYWRVCWGLITPLMMITVCIYSLTTATPYRYGQDYVYPDSAYLAGNLLQWSGMVLIPLFFLVTLWQNRSEKTWRDRIAASFRKKATYGPTDPQKKAEWKALRIEAKMDRQLKRKNWLHHIYLSLFGGYRKNV